MSAILGTALACLCLAAGARAQEGDGAPVEAWLARLAAAEARGAEEGERAVREGLELGPAAAAGALLGGGERFLALDLRSRRARAWLLGATGDERAIEPALGLLADGDREVRSAAIAFLSQPDLGEHEVERRAAALEELAVGASDRSSAVEAVAGLARIDHELATAALARLMRALPAPERRLAARGLAAEPRAREELVRTVQDAFAGEIELSDDVQAELLGAYGQRLAELPQGGSARADRAPFVLGARHPDPEVQRLAALAREGFVARALTLGDLPRAVEFLEALLGLGLGDAELVARRARLVLIEGTDFEPALAAARALRGATSLASADPEERLAHASGALLEGAALFALGRAAEARAAFDAAERVLAGLAAERLELAGSERLALLAANASETRAVIETYRALELLAAGAARGDAPVLEHVRAAHEHGLEAHLAMLAGDLPLQGAECIDGVLEHPFGPLSLVLSNPESQSFPRRRALDLALALCEAQASAAPTELPGFTRAESLEPRLTNPLEDPVRGALLGAIQGEFYRYWEREIARELERLAGDPRKKDVERRVWQVLGERRASDEREQPRSRLRLRAPGDLAIRLAEQLREEGRFGEARALAERIEVDLGASEDVRQVGPFANDFTRDLLAAQARYSVGNSWMDENQPERAEALCLEALEQFELLEQVMREQGATSTELAQAQIGQVDALVSLAVNANVKQGDPEQALAYFERAYAMRRDDFTQVLLACYRARAGRALEAREALRETPVVPANYYNLACTFALLGDAETALDFLRRDLDEKRRSPGALARQQAWARDDPDLAALRGDPRFAALVEQSH